MHYHVLYAFAFSVLLFSLIYANPAHAQQTGVVQGVVTDVDGEPLPGANVIVVGLQIGATANADGRYRIEVPAGTQELSASYVGFRTQQVTVQVNAGRVATRDFELPEDFVGAGEVVVIGTRRAGRTVVDSPVPVDVISPVELQSAGFAETQQILQLLVPSYNAPQASITDGSDHIRPATLRGLGPDQVLVLVNGRRRHTSALVHVNGSVGRGSTGTDLNAIPAGAIERVEVLRDGAAAQYGSDAIAGVINVVLKEREGFDAQVSYGQYFSTEEIGYAPGEGLLPGEAAADYPWALADQSDFDALPDDQTSGLVYPGAPESRTFTDGNTLNAHAGYGFGLAGGTTYLSAQLRLSDYVNRAGLDPRSQYYDGYLASDAFDPAFDETSFDRLNHRYGNGSFEEYSLFFNSSIPVSESGAQVYLFGGASQRDGLSGCFFRRSLDNRTNRALYPDGFLPKISSVVSDLSLAGGVKGNVGGWALDLSETVGSNRFNFNLDDSHNASISNGQTEFDAGTLGFAQATTNLDVFRAVEIGTAAPLSIALGAEFRWENYIIDAGEETSYERGDRTVEDGPNAGSSTAPGSQCFPGFQPASERDETRTNVGVYLDLENNLTSRWLLSAAGRFENYSDFGSTVTGKLATRFELAGGFAVRGAVSTGFRAPSLAQAWFTSIATNFIEGVPFEVGTFPVESDVARALGATDLDPERSQNLSAGLTFNQDNLSVTVDGYYIAIGDRITFTENFTSDAVAAFLQERGIGATGGRYFTNALDTETLGLDVIARFAQPLGRGTARFTAAFNINETEVTNTNADGVIAAPQELQALDEPELVDRVRVGDYEVAQPASKLNLQVNYDLSNWAFLVRANRYGEVTALDSDPVEDFTLSPKWLADVEVAYTLRDGIRVAAGANNVFDVYPDKALKINSFNGIFPYDGFSPFGFFGRYVYTRLSVQL